MDSTTCLTYLLMISFFSIVLSKEKKVCLTYDEGTWCEEESLLKLNRIPENKVGEERVISDGHGKTWWMKTISEKPLILEIHDFLSPQECDSIIQLAEEAGLEPSITVQNVQQRNIVLLDENKDQKLTVEEMMSSIQSGFDIFLDSDDILNMYKRMDLDKDRNGFISREEMESTTPSMMKAYLADLVNRHPEKHSRYSKQAWLSPDSSKDPVFLDIQTRISKVFHLPLELLMRSDFQVVKYEINGHYNAHYDSSLKTGHTPCCDKEHKIACRICRYMTVFLYLNDVEDGGETSFPFSGQETINYTKTTEKQVHNLFKNCNNGVRVKPKKVKAIAWYNHVQDPENGWLGDLDNFTFHGGCPVHRGTKWIANFWIKATDNKSYDIKKLQEEHIRLKNGRLRHSPEKEFPSENAHLRAKYDQISTTHIKHSGNLEGDNLARAKDKIEL